MSGAYRNNIDNSFHYPYYQSFERRIQRFKNWTGSVDPRLLARAGFFYTGMHVLICISELLCHSTFNLFRAYFKHTLNIYLKKPYLNLFILCVYVHVDREDYVICFACGIGVKNWDSSCDPWSEHQKYKPKCPFLQTGLKDYKREIEVKTKLLYSI